MIQGLYTATAAMALEAMKPEWIGHNLSNMNTFGYKEVVSSRDFRRELSAAELASMGKTFMRVGGGVMIEGSTINLAQGPLVTTGNPLDLALAGEGFFSIRTADGDRYTRGGLFHRDADGYLVTVQGDRVLGNEGPVKLGEGLIVVDSAGNISAGGEAIDQLKLVNFDHPEALGLAEGGLYAAGSAEPLSSANIAVKQGFLEGANVDVTTALVELMMALRSYQAGLKLFQLQDSTLEKAVNQVGRVV